MRSKYLLFILIIIISGWVFTGCRERIDLTLDSTFTRLVVEGSITDEAKAHRVLLTLSGDYLTDQLPAGVSGAVVEITDGVQTFSLSEVAPGVYETGPTVRGVVGREYTLIITGVDVDQDGEPEIYKATDLLKPVMILDSVVVEQQKPLTTPPVYKVSGWGQEPPTPDDCYQWLYYINGKLQTDTLYKTIFVDDTFVNGSYIPGLTMFMDVIASQGDTIQIETRALSRSYYDFLVTFMLEAVWNQGGGAGPPANIKGNISNGAIGYFSAMGVSYTTAIVP
ncbi:MAG: DUF4249 domain-containing protein [Bacteroidales bacterium]